MKPSLPSTAASTPTATSTSTPTRTVALHLVGANGLLAGEFLRLIAAHPHLQLAGAYARRADVVIEDLHPHLGGALARVAIAELSQLPQRLHAEHQAGQPQVLLLCLPHGVAARWYAEHSQQLEALGDDLRILDLSADFRLQSERAYQAAYGTAHPCAPELGQWAYGLPELHPIGPQQRRVALPGCFATAMQLAVMPAAASGLLDTASPWILHGVTGSSGSGATALATTHHPHRDGNFRAYALGGHRHEAELLAPRNFEHPPTVDFSAHSGPFRRGIHLHAVLPLLPAGEDHDWPATFSEVYADAPFLQVGSEAPELRQVVGSNRALLGVHRRGRLLHVLCALDNTLKGGAGQALQCLNLMLGWPPTTALPLAGLGY